VCPGGLLIWNRSPIDVQPERTDIETLEVRANEIAEAAGSYRAANMVVLGLLLKRRSGIASLEAVSAALSGAVSARHRELNEVNRAALKRGYELA
jgi:2-oxoglutarate ferredoxin oxidoreductase subunit gamma